MRFIYTLLLPVIVALIGTLTAKAQAGIGTTTPDANAILDITSTTKGLLLPRLSTTQQTTLAGSLNNGEKGMLIRDSASGKPVFWSGSAWKDASGLTITATTPLKVSNINNIALNPGTNAGDLITWDGTNWVNMQPAIQHFNLTVDNRQPYLAVNYCIALQGVFPSQNSSTPFISEIEVYAFNFAPKGFAACNGQLMSISSNTALFSLIGTFYGGNGVSTFALPNLQGRVPIHMGTGTGLSTYTVGQTGGSESNTLTR